MNTPDQTPHELGGDVLVTGTGERRGPVLCPVSGWLNERYRVVEKLGEGGMGVVLRCWDQWRERDVALKLLHPWLGIETQDQLQRELLIQEKLSHEGIVRTHDLGRLSLTDGMGGLRETWFFTMEWVEGLSLEQVLGQHKAHGELPLVSLSWLLEWLEGITDILTYAHKQGVIHRDLKPSNIMLTSQGVKLLDFGIAMTLDDDETSLPSDQAGTAYYMAPEQLEPGGRISPATDVYAVGVMLYLMLTGQVPTGRVRGPSEVLASKGARVPFGAPLDEALLKALEPEPEARYGTVESLCQGVKKALGQVGGRKASSSNEHKAPLPTEVPALTSQTTQASEAPLVSAPEVLSIDGQVLFEVSTPKARYAGLSLLVEGDISQVYEATALTGPYRGKPLICKWVEQIGDNDLMRDELRHLQLLAAGKGRQVKHLPVVVDHFVAAKGDGRMGVLMERLEGVDGEEILDAYPEGVPAAHMVWILRRLLSVLGYAHSLGMLHGNIDPSHIFVRPDDHNVHLLDWSYAIVSPQQTGQGFKCFNELYSPPEVSSGRPPLPSSDLYSLGKCMIQLVGGDLETNEMPDTVDPRIQRFLHFFVRESALQRARDAWQLYHQLAKLRKAVFGKHRFLPFAVPAAS